MMKKTAARLALALGLLAAAAVQAQDYPSRPIKWIVPYLAGTSPDMTVRILAEAMSGLLRQPVVVDNKPGAAGNLGAQLAARAAPDGYTWVYSGTPMATSMRMYRKPGFDVMKDFVHIGRIGISDTTVVASPEAGLSSLGDLLDRARKQPGKLSFASGGVGSPAHMGAELMLGAAGAQALHVPYKGASESANAVMGRQVDFALTISSVSLPHVQGGKLLPLAVTGAARNPHLPQVPTLAESGLPVTLVSIGGLSVPAATPPAVVRRITDTLARALATPEVRARIEALGGQVAPSTPDEYAQALRAEMAATEKMMKAARLEAQ
jgi:tripartite-type tricarboxylate transporter receptor subunit TctC